MSMPSSLRSTEKHTISASYRASEAPTSILLTVTHRAGMTRKPHEEIPMAAELTRFDHSIEYHYWDVIAALETPTSRELFTLTIAGRIGLRMGGLPLCEHLLVRSGCLGLGRKILPVISSIAAPAFYTPTDWLCTKTTVLRFPILEPCRSTSPLMISALTAQMTTSVLLNERLEPTQHHRSCVLTKAQE